MGCLPGGCLLEGDRRRVGQEVMIGVDVKGELQFARRHALHDPILTHVTLDQRPFGLLLLDISNFARVNSTYGVSVGDSILVIAADRMRTCVRPSDVVGRLGNDDFQILYSDGINSQADLKASVDRVVAALNFEYDLAGLKIEIQVDAASIFVEVPHPESEQIYRRADVNLAVAKREARVVLEVF